MKYFSFQWHILDDCDQRCKHCYIFSEDNNIKLSRMTWEQMQYVLSECEDMCSKMNRKPYFYITGGDPILHKDFWKLLELLKQKNIPFTLMGNPFHLTNEVCNKLKELGCEKYQMSIDGLEETHDYFRKPGSFKTTLEKIKCINQAGIDSVIMTTVSGTNLKEIPDIVDLAVKNEVSIFAFGRYCPTSLEKAKQEGSYIAPKDYRELLDTCYKKYEKYKDSKTYFCLKDHLWNLYLYEEGKYKIDNNLSPNLIYDGCHCGSGHFTILPNGDLYACRRMESKVGNIFEESKSLYDIWTSKNMDEYRKWNDFEKCSKCELLRFCRGCPAVSYGYTHNMYSADPQCWKDVFKQ